MSPSSDPSPERPPPPPRDQPSREQVNQAILGLGRNYVSAQRIDDRPADESTRLWQPSAEAVAADNIVYAYEQPSKARGIIWGLLTLLVAGALVILLGAPQLLPDALAPLTGHLPKDPLRAALRILDAAPVIDGHIDLPILLRSRFGNNVSAVDLSKEFVGHVDIPRLRQGKVGGFFWSVYVGCPNPEIEGKDFLGASWRVRDTLEQIDVARLTIDKYPDVFQYALGSQDIRDAIIGGKIASLLGVEGGHQLGNSIAVLRQYHALGVRYVTLTHTCHNAFADSCGFEPGMIPLHGGLSPLGLRLIDEMNRLGVLVDLSHTSDDTARQALKHSKAPVIWSHSSARAVHDVPRNVPDDVLALVGTSEGQTDAVVMVNFAPFFVADPGNATVYSVADHVEHIAKIAGKFHVGLGSDYDGIDSTPVGLEDVSKYPALIAELYTRGWTKYELAGLTGGNLLRVFEGAEKASRDLKAAGTPPVFDVYPKRTDLPIL
ncbi:membrane dipeptidase-domain-containing protein [Mycena metata]|uniref:Dipeptidase n=1 Tax=Mycena metata TaxID=1033252 RepID=A0AAD7KE07_9AGAR|nr:membrane dipeptidase-domain-containing protein [Mycena metata]